MADVDGIEMVMAGDYDIEVIAMGLIMLQVFCASIADCMKSFPKKLPLFSGYIRVHLKPLSLPFLQFVL